MVFKFEKLIVWQKALELTELVDSVAKKFPREELYVLGAQIKRAADSTALNIAEGSTGQTNPEFSRFLKYAKRSDIEVVGCIFIAQRRKIICEEDFNRIYQLCEEILRMLNSLCHTLKN